MASSDESRSFLKRLADLFSFLGLKLIFLLSKILPMSVLTFIFASLAVLFSPFMTKTYLILENLRRAMPKLSYGERILLMFRIWYSLGRTAGEYPYIYRFKDRKIFEYTEISENLREILDKLKGSTKGSIIFSGHLSNWEIGLRALKDYGLKVAVIFRRLNNPLLEPEYSENIRKKLGINMIAKQDGAAFSIVKSLRKGENVVILMDQRDEMNGVLIDFFGRKAFTARSIYIIAKKMDIPVYGMRVVRKGMTSSKFLLDADRECFRAKNMSEEEFLTCINGVLEKWIEEHPEQWFWIHNRWKT